MKNFGAFAMVSIFYVLLVLLFHGISGAELVHPPPPPMQGNIPQAPSGVRPPSPGGIIPPPMAINAPLSSQGVQGEGVQTPKFPTQQQQQQVSKNGSSGNPLVDMFQVEDPDTMNLLDTAYGTYTGNDQCKRKSACLLGNSMKEMPGRDLMFLFLRGYVPTEYSLFYDIVRNAAMYGQNCDVYVCTPQSPTQQAKQNAQTTTKTPSSHSFF